MMKSLLAIIAKCNFPISEMSFVCINHCWGVYEQNSIVNSVGVDDWIAEWAIIAKDLAKFPSWLSKEVKHCCQISWL